MELYSQQAVLMVLEHLETKEDCDRFLDRNEAKLAMLTRKRSDLYNGIRRCTKEEAERIARMRKTWREYDLPPEERHTIECDAPDRYQSPEDGTVTNVSNIRKDGRNDR